MNTNKILFLTALGSILLAVIIIPMIIFKPWIPIDPLYVSGKIFYLRITEPLILDQIVFNKRRHVFKETGNYIHDSYNTFFSKTFFLRSLNSVINSFIYLFITFDFTGMIRVLKRKGCELSDVR